MCGSFSQGKAMNNRLEHTHALHDLGLAYIRNAIRTSLAEVDAEIAAAGILHSASSRRLPPPDVVPITVMPSHGPVITVEFTDEEIQRCCRGIDDPRVARKVASYAEQYRHLRNEPASYRHRWTAPLRNPGSARNGSTQR
jgi:hypothetical protein